MEDEDERRTQTEPLEGGSGRLVSQVETRAREKVGLDINIWGPNLAGVSRRNLLPRAEPYYIRLHVARKDPGNGAESKAYRLTAWQRSGNAPPAEWHLGAATTITPEKNSTFRIQQLGNHDISIMITE